MIASGGRVSSSGNVEFRTVQRSRRKSKAVIGAVLVSVVLILAAPMLLQTVFGTNFFETIITLGAGPISGDDSTNPAVAASGNFVHVVRTTNSSATDTDIYATSSSIGGSSLSSDLNISASPLVDSLYPQVAASGSSVHYVWLEQSMIMGFGPFPELYYARSSDNGGSIDLGPTNLTPGFAVVGPMSIAANGSNVYIAYVDFNNTLSRGDLAFIQSTDNGLTFSSPIYFDVSNPQSASFNSLYVDGSNAFLVWEGKGFSDTDIFIKKGSVVFPGGITWDEGSSLGGAQVNTIGPGGGGSDYTTSASGNTLTVTNAGATTLGVYTIKQTITTTGGGRVASVVGGPFFPTPPDPGASFHSPATAFFNATGGNTHELIIRIPYSTTDAVAGVSLGNVTVDISFSPPAGPPLISTGSGGPSVSSAIDISEGTGFNDHSPDVAAADGMIYAAWEEQNTVILNDFLIFSRSPAGGNFSPPTILGSSVHSPPSIIALDSNVTVAWGMGPDEPPDPQFDSVAYRKSIDHGAIFGPLNDRLTGIPPSDTKGGTSPDMATNSTLSYLVWRDGDDAVVLTNDASTPPAAVSLEFVSNVSPKFDIDEVSVSGLVINDSPGDYVEVSWGDGEVTQFTPVAGAWGPVSHIYGSDAIGPATIQPSLFDSGDNLRAVGSFAFVTVSPHDTAFLMNDIGRPATDTPLTVSGILLDANTGAQLPEGQTVFFDGTGAAGLASVTTGGITITDPDGVTIEACSACIPDVEGATENMLVRLNVGGMLTFSAGTQSVQLEIQASGTDMFTFEVTEVGGPSFTTDSFGTAPDQTNLFISAPNGIASVELVSTSGSAAGISSITTSNPLNTPQEMIHADLENVGAGTYGPSLTLESGAFFGRATAFSSSQSGLDVQASYGGNLLYSGSSSATQFYDVVDRTWGAAGDPAPGAFNVDAGTGINTIKCATDADGDGLCSTWESTGLVSYAGANHDLCNFECPAGESQKDVYVEIDSMANHVPPAAAIGNVIQAFANVPNADLPLPRVGSGIALHVQLDNSLTHANLIEVWKDTAADSAQDDFEDIKANNFGTATERGGGLLAANNALKAKAEVYHYGISVHGIGNACNAATPSGIGETPGNDFVISLGCGFFDSAAHSGSEGDQNEFEGTLMHELGHNLNLGHGGPKEFRELPGGNSLVIPGSPYAVTDNSGTTRAFTISGFQVDTDQARTGTVIIPVSVFTSDPGATTVSSITQSGDGLDIAIVGTPSAFISGTGNSRLVTLKVAWSTSGDVTPVADGALGTFTVNLNIATAGATMPTPTTPAVGPQLKINVGSNSDMNCKVPYQSVMSYTRQFDSYLGAYYVLDYSRSAITPPVTEANTNAEGGFFNAGGAAGSKLVSAYTSGASRAYVVSTYPDVDWSGTGGIAGSFANVDSNNFGITGCGASANDVQRGYDDWANIQLDFKEGISSFDGQYSDPRQDLEATGQMNDDTIAQVDESTTTTTANPPGGFYSTAQSVELTADGVATIHYTTDGSLPDENSPVYSGEIPISTTTTVLFFSISATSGNPEVLRTEVYNFDDTTPPEITVIGDIEDGEQFFFGGVPAEPTCTAIDTGSGVNSDGCVVTGYSTALGSHTLVFTAEDNAGNEATVEIDYTVGAWTLLGFYSPTNMPPTVNVINAGKTVPLKFEVFAGSTELTDIAVVNTLKSLKVSCDPLAPTDPVEESMASPGGTVLRYEDGQFMYNWKTPTTKACYDVVLTLDDGSKIMAHFKTK